MSTVVLAANNAEVGGGEVMLLACGVALRELGVDVEVVGPTVDGGVLDRAVAQGFPVHRLDPDRRRYMARLRRWTPPRGAWLWCHGLVPALATAGHRNRIVQLHQVPAPAHRVPARAARHGAAAVLVPSHATARAVPGAEVLWNWTAPVPTVPRRRRDGTVRVGFMGRLAVDKGVDVLAEALAHLEVAAPGRHRLVLAGDHRFVPADQRPRVDAALAQVTASTDALGWVDRDTFFGAVDLAVFPSVVDEAFGLVVAEAMSARVPIVVSDAGALPEVVGPDHPWVVPRGDTAALAMALDDVHRTDDDRLTTVLDAAQGRWTDHFSPDAGRHRVAQLAARLGIISPDLASPDA